MDINLLPWREEIITYNKKVFFWIMSISLVMSGFFLIFIYHLFFGQIEYTKSYTQALESAKTNLISNVSAYFNDKKLQEKINARINVLQQLQESRYTTVRILNEITKIIPKGVYLTKMTRKDNDLEIEGLANSNLLIASFMQAIDKSSSLKIMSLQKVEKTEEKKVVATQFAIQLSLKSPSLINLPKKESSTFHNPIESIQKNAEEQNKLIDNAVKKLETGKSP